MLISGRTHKGGINENVMSIGKQCCNSTDKCVTANVRSWGITEARKKLTEVLSRTIENFYTSQENYVTLSIV